MSCTKKKSIGENIRTIRKERKLTQSQLAEQCGVSQSTITKCENGETSISFELAIKVSQALHIPLKFLTTDTPGDVPVAFDDCMRAASALSDLLGFEFYTPWEWDSENERIRLIDGDKITDIRFDVFSDLMLSVAKYYSFLIKDLEKTYCPEAATDGE